MPCWDHLLWPIHANFAATVYRQQEANLGLSSAIADLTWTTVEAAVFCFLLVPEPTEKTDIAQAPHVG